MNRSRPAHRGWTSRRSGRGTSLIEVMIAILLLSFGIMGLLGLKLVGLRTTGHSHSRSTAALHASEIIDRMRANPVRALAGEYNVAFTSALPPVPAGIAQIDVVEWRQGIAQNLPSGLGSVTLLPDGTVRVALQWAERGDESGATRQVSFNVEARL